MTAQLIPQQRVVMFQKIIICASMLMMSTWATAMECGRWVRLAEVVALSEALEETWKDLRPHVASLNSEIGNPAANAEHGRLSYVQSIQTDLANVLSRLALLIAIRDQMVDKRDRLVLEKLLSLATRAAAEDGGLARDRIDFALTKIARPAIAVDVGRIRDVAANTQTTFAAAVVLILGIPVFLMLHKFRREGWASLAIAGLVLGTLPAAFSWPRPLEGFSAGGNWHGKYVETYVNGAPTTYAWLTYGENVLFFALHGLVGALVFYAIWRTRERLNKSSQPTASGSWLSSNV